MARRGTQPANLEGRIAAITDVFDVLTSETVYRPGYALEKAIDIMLDCSGRHFDPVPLEPSTRSLVSARTAAALESHVA